jgi:hypothetical protein
MGDGAWVVERARYGVRLTCVRVVGAEIPPAKTDESAGGKYPIPSSLDHSPTYQPSCHVTPGEPV